MQDVFLNETFQERFAAGGAWGTGRGESHFRVAPEFPSRALVVKTVSNNV